MILFNLIKRVAIIIAAVVLSPVLSSVILPGSVITAEVLDEGQSLEPWLLEISDDLHQAGVDVLANLNHREISRQRPQKPRLGMFPDLPLQQYPQTSELLSWESEFTNGDINGVAILVVNNSPAMPDVDYPEFTRVWLGSAANQRVFVSFHESDSAHAANLIQILQARGYATMNFDLEDSAEYPGRLYATAGLRMAIDSRVARRFRSDVSEFDYLGERVRRNSNSLFADNRGEGRRLARGEPSVFRKDTLGDEYEASTIEEIIVPGGIAFGEVAELPANIDSLIFSDTTLRFRKTDGGYWRLPDEELATLKALFDFVQRSETIRSDAVVDIDADGRVKISSQFRDTGIGYQFMEIDAQPFEFVRGLPVTKSVIIDTAVKFEPESESDSLTYSTVYEVRFLSADTMRIAQTRVALEYEYAAIDGSVRNSYSWGRDLGRLDENLDYDGLGNVTAGLAGYAAWTALFRRVHLDRIEFLHGRYEFMKIEKTGRRTPSRF